MRFLPRRAEVPSLGVQERPPFRDRRGTRVLLAAAPIASFVVGIAVVVLNRTLIPARFFYDSNQIHHLAASGNASVDFSDPSYGSVAAVYRIVGLGDNELLAGLMTYLFAALVVYTAFRLRDFVITPAGAMAGSLALLVAAVYLGTYSKDLFVLPIALVALRARNGWVGHLAVLIALALYANMFRQYWFLNAGLYGVYLIVGRPRVPRWVIVLLPVVALVAIALVAYWGFGIQSDFARSQVNDIRQGTEDARTAITPFVDWPGPLAPLVNTVVTLLTIVLPVPLLLRGQVYYLVAAAAFVTIWVTFLLGVRRIRAGSVGRRCMLLILSVVTTQALFEPDYGSALRHLAPLLAVFTFVALHSRAPRKPGSRRDLRQDLEGARRTPARRSFRDGGPQDLPTAGSSRGLDDGASQAPEEIEVFFAPDAERSSTMPGGRALQVDQDAYVTRGDS